MPLAARLCLAALGGCLRFLSVPGFDRWPCAFVYLVPVLFALAGVSRRGALGVGLVFGLTGNLCGYYWLLGTLRDFSSFPLWLGLVLYAVLCLYQSGEYVLAAWLIHRLRERGLPLVVAAPAAVLTGEMVFPLLFPNFVGAALHCVPLLVQAADVGGPLLLSAVVVGVNVALFETLGAIVRRRTPVWRDLALGFGGLALLAAYGALRLPRIEGAMAGAPALRVGLVQVNMGIFEKSEEPLEGLKRHIEQSKELLAKGPIDLLVWPESAYNFVIPEPARNLRDAVTGGGIPVPVMFGGLRLVRGMRAEEDRLYNAAFLLDAGGNVLGSYDKTYLLMFGEHLPFGETFPFLYDWSPRTGRFTTGTRLDPLPLGRYRVSALICYEDILPRFVRAAAAAGRPHLLVNLTNDAWFGRTVEPEIHLGLAKLRAVEQRRFLVRATNTGVSAVIDATGRVTVRTGIFVRETVSGEARLLDIPTVYCAVGDVVGWAALAVAVPFAVRRRIDPGGPAPCG